METRHGCLQHTNFDLYFDLYKVGFSKQTKSQFSLKDRKCDACGKKAIWIVYQAPSDNASINDNNVELCTVRCSQHVPDDIAVGQVY